jgi:hypothetical protein
LIPQILNKHCIYPSEDSSKINRAQSAVACGRADSL